MELYEQYSDLRAILKQLWKGRLKRNAYSRGIEQGYNNNRRRGGGGDPVDHHTVGTASSRTTYNNNNNEDDDMSMGALVPILEQSTTTPGTGDEESFVRADGHNGR